MLKRQSIRSPLLIILHFYLLMITSLGGLSYLLRQSILLMTRYVHRIEPNWFPLSLADQQNRIICLIYKRRCCWKGFPGHAKIPRSPHQQRGYDCTTWRLWWSVSSRLVKRRPPLVAPKGWVDSPIQNRSSLLDLFKLIYHLNIHSISTSIRIKRNECLYSVLPGTLFCFPLCERGGERLSIDCIKRTRSAHFKRTLRQPASKLSLPPPPRRNIINQQSIKSLGYKLSSLFDKSFLSHPSNGHLLDRDSGDNEIQPRFATFTTWIKRTWRSRSVTI